jgi:carbonic anhydrase
MRQNPCRTLLLTLVICAPCLAQSWNHDPGSPIGPKSWGGTCESGIKQTPVDLAPGAARKSELPALEFHYKPTHLVVKNLSHAVEVENESEESSLIAGPAAADRYHLVQFHFHTPSEHTIAGVAAKMELHLVHRNAAGRLAVVGVLLNADGKRANPLFDRIFTNAPEKAGSGPAAGELNPVDLLPPDRTYFTYDGSLTTPPCSEGVRWFVMTNPGFVSQAAIEKLQRVLAADPGNNRYSYNNRPLQPLNGREVLLSR